MISVTAGFPMVRVPVLSKATTLISRANCKEEASLMMMPFWAALAVAAMTAVGTARPKVQGQAIIKTVINTVRAKRKPLPKRNQIENETRAIKRTAGTK